MANVDTAKTWFETGDKPTQAQFHQLLAWLRFKDQPITMDDIQGLTTSLGLKLDKAIFNAFEQGQKLEVNGDTEYVIPPGYILEKIIVIPGSNCTPYAMLGPEEIVPQGDETIVTPAEGVLWVTNILALSQKTLSIFGLPADSSVIYFKRKIA